MQYHKYVRVDERLIHGQVLVKWLKKRRCERVIIIDDTIQENPILKSVMQKSLPKGIRLDILGLTEGAEFLKEQTLEDAPLLLVREIAVLKKMEECGILFREINIARIPEWDGKDKICDKVYMDKEEIQIVRHFLEQGSQVYVQMVPDSEVIWLKNILK